MSSYLNFYLVPKKKEGTEDEPKPLCFMSYSRSNPVYESYRETVNPVFIGNDTEYQYTELSTEDANRVVDSAKEDLESVKKRYEANISIYKELGKMPDVKAISDLTETKEYMQELQDNINELQFIANMVSDIALGYTDFGKVLINID